MLTYEAHYQEGILISSKSYNLDGNISVEDWYYPNGAIKEKIEYYSLNGKKMKEMYQYDKKGNRL